MNARWVCGRCNTGVLAPTRPRMDDVRRYCLKCSEEIGRLVKRTAPALEKKRELRAVARKVASKSERESKAAREAEKFTWLGCDLREEMKRMLKMKVFKEYRALHKAPVKLHVRHCKRSPSSRVGVAWYWKQRIQVSVWPGRSLVGAQRTLLHELIHLALPLRGHDSVFKALMVSAWHEYKDIRTKHHNDVIPASVHALEDDHEVHTDEMVTS